MNWILTYWILYYSVSLARMVQLSTITIIVIKTCCLSRTILDSLFLQWPEMIQDKFQRSAWRLISNSTTWGIWLLRNKIIFEEGTISLFDCFSTILHQIAIWLHILDSNFTYTGNDLLRSSDDIKLWCNKKS